MNRRATQLPVTHRSDRLGASPVLVQSDWCCLSAAMLFRRHQVSQARQTMPTSSPSSGKKNKCQLQLCYYRKAGYLNAVYIHPSIATACAKPTPIGTESQSIDRSQVVCQYFQTFPRHWIPQSNCAIKWCPTVDVKSAIELQISERVTNVAMMSIPAVSRGHHAILLTECSWPSRTMTRSDSDKPGIESGERLPERSDTFHIRAVRSSAHDASRVRDGLHLIWLISFSWPL